MTLEAWSTVIGQPDAVRRLSQFVGSPVHAYLFVGPRGSGKRTAAAVFAGELLAAVDGDRAGLHRRRAAREEHPDVLILKPISNQLRAEEAERVIVEASRSPVETSRKVLVIDRFHTATPEAAGALLKTVEEPVASTIFIVLVEEVLPEHATIASRCTRVDFHAVADEVVAAALEAEGLLAGPSAKAVAAAAVGNLDRARVLATDDRVVDRHEAWWSIPEKLDGTGAVVAVLTEKVRGLITEALEPLAVRHRAELAQLDQPEEHRGTVGSGRSHVEVRHRRERRQFRTDELRFGLATLVSRYRAELDSATFDSGVLRAIDRVRRTYQSLTRNPNEALALQSLLLDLPGLAPTDPPAATGETGGSAGSEPVPSLSASPSRPRSPNSSAGRATLS